MVLFSCCLSSFLRRSQIREQESRKDHSEDQPDTFLVLHCFSLTSKNSAEATHIKEQQPRHLAGALRFRFYPPLLSYSGMGCVSSCHSVRGEYKWSRLLQKAQLLQPRRATPEPSYRH